MKDFVRRKASNDELSGGSRHRIFERELQVAFSAELRGGAAIDELSPREHAANAGDLVRRQHVFEDDGHCEPYPAEALRR